MINPRSLEGDCPPPYELRGLALTRADPTLGGVLEILSGSADGGTCVSLFQSFANIL